MVVMNHISEEQNLVHCREIFRWNLFLKHSILEREGGRTEGSLPKSGVYDSLRYFCIGRCFVEENG